MVEVVVPWRPGCPARERNWCWIRHRYEAEGFLVVESPAPPGPWSKGAALAPVIAASTADIVIQADADCFTDGLPAAVEAIEEGAPWAIPHDLLYRLGEEGTVAVLEGARWADQPLAEGEDPYKGIEAGGILVAPRENLLQVGVDPRFVGWGHDDESHSVALRTLVGEPWRGDAPLIHLWHPPQKRTTRRRGSQESWDLRYRYFTAKDDPDAMRRLIKESRDHHAADEPAGDHHPALR